MKDVRVHNRDAFGLLKLRDTCQTTEPQRQSEENVEFVASVSNGGPAINSAESLNKDIIPARHADSKEYLQCDPMELVLDSQQNSHRSQTTDKTGSKKKSRERDANKENVNSQDSYAKIHLGQN